MTGGAVHQGLALRVRPYAYAHADDLIRTGTGQAPLIVALDGVTDPRNLGAVARSVAAFGGNGVLVPARRSAGVTAGAWKASAGALARVPVAQAPNLASALAGYAKAGLFIVGLDADAGEEIGELSLATAPWCWSSAPRARACPGWSASTATQSSRSRSAAPSPSTPRSPLRSRYTRCASPGQLQVDLAAALALAAGQRGVVVANLRRLASAGSAGRGGPGRVPIRRGGRSAGQARRLCRAACPRSRKATRCSASPQAGRVSCRCP